MNYRLFHWLFILIKPIKNWVLDQIKYTVLKVISTGRYYIKKFKEITLNLMISQKPHEYFHQNY